MTDTRAVVEAFFAKSGANDLSVIDLFADEIEFFLPGDPKFFPWAGMHRRGGAALIEVFKAVWASREAGKGQVVGSQLIVEGENAAWVGWGVSHEMNETSRNKGQRFSLDVAVHFRVRDGKIVRLYAIEDMTGLAAAYGYIEIR